MLSFRHSRESLRKLKTTFKDKSQTRAIQVRISEAEARYEKLQQDLNVWEVSRSLASRRHTCLLSNNSLLISLQGYLREATGGEAPNGRLSEVSATTDSRPVSIAPSVPEATPTR